MIVNIEHYSENCSVSGTVVDFSIKRWRNFYWWDWYNHDGKRNNRVGQAIIPRRTTEAAKKRAQSHFHRRWRSYEGPDSTGFVGGWTWTIFWVIWSLGWMIHHFVVGDDTVMLVVWTVLLSFWSAKAITKWRKENGSNRRTTTDSGSTGPGRTGHTAAVAAGLAFNPAGTRAAASAGITRTTIGPGQGIVVQQWPVADPVEKPPLEVVQREEPFVAYKRAWIQYLPGKQKIAFTGVGHAQRYETEATFVCARTSDRAAHLNNLINAKLFGGPVAGIAPIVIEHVKPAPDCTCGFYGYKSLADMERGGWTGCCTLEVEFYGTVIEHELGFRAEKQRVLSVTLDPQCSSALCDADAHWLGLEAAGELPTALLNGYCDQHADLLLHSAVHTPINTSQLASLLGTEVKWAKRKEGP